MSATVACVLKAGGDFDARWVRALSHGVFRYLPWSRFVCLTDMAVPGIRTIPLLHGWKGWWSKIEALRPDALSGPILYLDLDLLPVGDLSDMAGYRGEFAMIENLGKRQKDLQSGVMAFRAGPGTYAASLYEAFCDRTVEWMARYRGDGEWLNDHVDGADVLQRLYPGQICSYKYDAKDGPPPGTRLCLGHGQPRFSSPRAGWAHAAWKAAAT